MLSCQIALYPLRVSDIDKVIVDSLEVIKILEEKGLNIEMGSMSTVINGEDNLVWEAIRKLFDEASKNGQQIVLSMLISNECGCKI